MRKEVDRGNEEEAQEGRQEQAGLLTRNVVRVLMGRRLARLRTVTSGRVAASLALYEAALERAKG